MNYSVKCSCGKTLSIKNDPRHEAYNLLHGSSVVSWITYRTFSYYGSEEVAQRLVQNAVNATKRAVELGLLSTSCGLDVRSVATTPAD